MTFHVLHNSYWINNVIMFLMRFSYLFIQNYRHSEPGTFYASGWYLRTDIDWKMFHFTLNVCFSTLNRFKLKVCTPSLNCIFLNMISFRFELSGTSVSFIHLVFFIIWRDIHSGSAFAIINWKSIWISFLWRSFHSPFHCLNERRLRKYLTKVRGSSLWIGVTTL